MIIYSEMELRHSKKMMFFKKSIQGVTKMKFINKMKIKIRMSNKKMLRLLKKIFNYIVKCLSSHFTFKRQLVISVEII